MKTEDAVLLFARPAKIGFRDEVREYIGSGGISGVPRERVMRAFASYPTNKVTIALNELLARREAYLRSGIYRLTTRIELKNDRMS